MRKPSISKSTSPFSVALSFSKNISFGENFKTHGDQITGKRICESKRRFTHAATGSYHDAPDRGKLFASQKVFFQQSIPTSRKGGGNYELTVI